MALSRLTDPEDSVTSRFGSKKCRKQGFSGPFVRYVNIIPAERTWIGSILILLADSAPGAPEEVARVPPTLDLRHSGAEPREVSCLLLDVAEGWEFWRFSVRLCVQDHDSIFEYTIKRGDIETDCFRVHVPGISRPLHWAYYSCNGITYDVKETAPELADELYLWKDLLQVHDAFPMHLAFGGGDQVYSDDIWDNAPSVKAWCGLPDLEAKSTAEWTEVMQRESTEFYCSNYIDHFSARSVARVFATIPQVMCWDDHDIWDGYGSYPPPLEHCPVFDGLFEVAKRFYLLFQKHTTACPGGHVHPRALL